MVKQPRPVRGIPATLTTTNPDGSETIKVVEWSVMPPPRDFCQICAVKHEPGKPHNAQSLYYRFLFHSQTGRSPPWADAMAHCEDKVKKLWRAALERGGNWTEPPIGEPPIAHHGTES